MLTMLMFFAAAQAQDGPLELTCSGGGAANKADTATAWAADNNGNSGTAVVTRHHSEQFEDQVDLVIDGPNSRVRLPRTMLPPIHGGDDGWFKLKDVEIAPAYIRGTAGVNFMNSPKIYVDRRTGSINIDGKAGHYTGQCERAAEASQSTKF